MSWVSSPDTSQHGGTFSKLVRPSEPLCALAALLTGELIGYTYESHWRRSAYPYP